MSEIYSKDTVQLLRFVAKHAPDEFKAALTIPDKGGNTPLLVAAAAHHVNLELIKLLVSEGPDAVNMLNNGGFSVLSLLKAKRSSTYQEVAQLFKQNIQLKQFHKAQVERKALSHAWHLSGISPLIQADTKQKVGTIDLEGHWENEWFHMMSKDFNQFEEAYPELLDDKQMSLLKHLFDLGTNSQLYSYQEKVERIQAGLPTIIHSGFKGHAATLLVWVDQFVICNRGAASKFPIQVHHFDPNLLDANMLRQIEKTARSGSMEDYEQLVLQELPILLNFSQTLLDMRLQKASPLPDQTVGNCSFVSPLTSIYAFLLLANVRGINEDGSIGEGQLDSKVRDRIIKSTLSYQTWLALQQIRMLERAIEPLERGTATFEPDHPLIMKALRKAHLLRLDPVAQKRVEKLTTTYSNSLSSKERKQLNSDVAYWKTLSREPIL